MAVVEKKTQGVVVNQEAGVAFTEQEKIEVKRTTGKQVWVTATIYGKTNHYIKTSHNYVPEDKGRKLTRYIHYGYFHWIFLVLFVSGLFSPAFFAFALTMAAVSIPYVVVYAQHMYVVIVTIPIMLKLPHLPDNVMKFENDFFEVTLEKYRSVFAATPDTAVGVAVKSKGTIKIHVLSTRARNKVIYTAIFSVLGFGASIFMFIYCGAIGGYRLWQFHF